MKPPFARPLSTEAVNAEAPRRPRAFVPAKVTDAPQSIEAIVDAAPDPVAGMARPPGFLSLASRVARIAGGVLVAMALGLAAERLMRDLFATNPWLGWFGIAVLTILVLALIVIVIREAAALSRLRTLDMLKARAVDTLLSDRPSEGKAIVAELLQLYAARPDLARAREVLDANAGSIFDGGEHIRHAERILMAPLDARARALTAAAARRVALVTTVSPRALIDIAFVMFESVRLGNDIAWLYGARPGVFGAWRLLGAILAHLAVTGGLVLTDGVVEQLLGQGLAAKLSARLGEGVVNGLMTVRVGIAAMRVVRPLPYATQRRPVVKDFIPELANVLNAEKKS